MQGKHEIPVPLRKEEQIQRLIINYNDKYDFLFTIYRILLQYKCHLGPTTTEIV